MTDIIQQAIARANGASTTTLQSAKNQAEAVVSSTATTVKSKLPELPVERDPILVARQAEARAQLVIADAKEKLLTEKQNVIEQLGNAKSKAASTANAVLDTATDTANNAAETARQFTGSPNRQALGAKAVQAITSGRIPKLKQLSSTKISAALDAAKKAKQVVEERQAATVANLEKSTELFKFPLKPVIPEIPKPTIPSLPRIPDLPF